MERVKNRSPSPHRRRSGPAFDQHPVSRTGVRRAVVLHHRKRSSYTRTDLRHFPQRARERRWPCFHQLLQTIRRLRFVHPSPVSGRVLRSMRCSTDRCRVLLYRLRSCLHRVCPIPDQRLLPRVSGHPDHSRPGPVQSLRIPAPHVFAASNPHEPVSHRPHQSQPCLSPVSRLASPSPF